MSFHSPEFLLWLGAAPLCLFLYLTRSYARGRSLQRLLGRQKSFLLRNVSARKRRFKAAMSLLALALLPLALARPYLHAGETAQKIKSAGIHILLLADVSQSMLAEDIRPSRMAFMKKELSRLLDMSAGDQAGIMAFARSAVMVTPWTPDLGAAKSHLQDLSPDYFSSQGTNFARAFSLAKKAFQNIRDTKRKKAVKALIIASDGEDHSKEAKESLRRLLGENIRIFALAFGTKRGGVIPLRDYKGDIREYKKDMAGEPVLTRLNPSSLKSFARMGKGAYYRASYSGKAISRLRADLDQMEKTVFDQAHLSQKKELYQWPLLAAALLALAGAAAGSRRRSAA